MPFDPSGMTLVESPAEPAGFDPSGMKLVEEPTASSILANFLTAPDVGTSVSSPLTPGVLPSFDAEQVANVPATEAESIAMQTPNEPPLAIGAAPATVPRFGAAGTITRGASETIGGLVEWAMNKPEEALAALTPLAPAIAARYAPEIAAQFGKDVVAGVKGDREALGRAITIGALVGGPKAIVKARESALLRGKPTVAPERPADVAIQLQQPGAPELTRQDLRYLATTREPTLVEPPRIATTAPTPTPGEVIAPELLREAERPGRVERPAVGIDIVNEQGVRFGPEFWNFEPMRDALKPVPATAKAVKGGTEILKQAVEATHDTAKASETVIEAPDVAGPKLGGIAPWLREEMARQGLDPNRTFNDIDLANPSVREAILSDPTLTDAQKQHVLKTGSLPKKTAPQIRSALTPAEQAAAQAELDAALGQEPIGMGGAVPSEFTPPAQTTSTKNAIVDQERATRGLPPAIQPARRAFGSVWDEAMAKVDADPAAQDKLLASLRANPRAVTDTENALLLHRQVDLQNEYGKAARDLAQAVDDGRVEDAALHRVRVADFSDRLLDLYTIGKQVGTETGRGLAARRMLANEDFTLANMVTERRAVNKGNPLTDRQANETAQAQVEIATAAQEAMTNPSVEAEFKLDRAKKKWEGKLADDADANAPLPTRVLQQTGNLLNDIRTIRTSYDFSAALRQGKLALITRPGTWSKALVPSFRAALSPLNAFRIDHEIANRPNGLSGLYGRSGLYLAEAGHKLTGQEEAFITRGVARHVPGVKASERAYTTFLNKVRADLFDKFVATLSRDGNTVTLPEARVIAYYVNAITGRGDLGKFSAAAIPMATVFFAPRYVASRFQYILGQPLYYGALSGRVGWKEGARARKLVAGEYARALIGAATLYSTYSLFFDQHNTDPYSSDFAKLRDANTRLDPWAGLQQTTVLLSREAGGMKTTLKGKTMPIRGKVPYGGATAVDVGTQFLRSKLAPVPGVIVDTLQGKNVVGEPVTPSLIASDLLVPITYQDILSTLEDQGLPRASALTLLSVFGEGVQTYTAAPKRTK